jgi:hypothetical protein
VQLHEDLAITARQYSMTGMKKMAIFNHNSLRRENTKSDTKNQELQFPKLKQVKIKQL